MNKPAPERTADTGQAAAPSPLTARAAAARLGVNERTIRRAIARGELAAVKEAGSFQIALTDLFHYQATARGGPGFRPAWFPAAESQLAPWLVGTPGHSPTVELAPPLRLMPRPAPLQSWLAAWPRPLTTLIGRDRETDEIQALLRDDAVRLVTLTGPGGGGKTRLAIRAAEGLRPLVNDRLAFVSLAAIQAPDLVTPTIFRTLGGREVGADFVVERLYQLIGDAAGLIVLDNFEHLMAAALTVADLLAACPRLNVLVTSRAGLRLSGEHEYPVPPLTLPDVDAPLTPETALRAEAVRLFAQRARAAHPGFAVTPENVAAVTAICQRLDGLPLAIELAAARANHLSPQSLIARLDQPGTARLPLLTGGPRDLPARFQTMRAAIAWSYDLLTPPEQTQFQRQAVFVGGFSLTAAATIAGMDEAAVLESIAALVANSLVRHVSQDGESRYGMLETIREFGLERLTTSGEAPLIRQRHAEWCLAFAAVAGPQAKQAGAGQWLAALEREHANMRAALTWLADQGDGTRLVRLAGLLWPFWQEHTYFGEGHHWLALALRLGPAAPAADRLRALTGAGTLAWYQTDIPGALGWHEQALALAREVGDRVAEAFSLSNLGVQAVELGDLERGRASYEAGLALARAKGATEAETLALHNLALLTWLQGDIATAISRNEAALALARRHGWDWIVPTIVIWTGFMTADRGDVGRAAALLQEGLVMGEARGNLGDVVNAWEGLVRVGAATGQADAAARLLGATLTLRDEIAMPQPPTEIAYFQPVLARLRATLGDERFTAAVAAGRALPRAAAMTEARSFPVSGPAAGPTRRTPDAHGLTTREREILRLLVAGDSNREIGTRLYISETTVARHVANLLRKLAVDSRAKAVAYALHYRLAEPHPTDHASSSEPR